MSIPLLLDLALIGLLLLACAFDLAKRKIPNRLLALGLLVALVLHLMSGTPSALLSSYLAGFGVGLLMFLPLYLLGGMAAGDVKLMATVGAFCGPLAAVEISLATYVAGGGAGVRHRAGAAARQSGCAQRWHAAAAATDAHPGRPSGPRRPPGTQCGRHALRTGDHGRFAVRAGDSPRITLHLGITCFLSKTPCPAWLKSIL